LEQERVSHVTQIAREALSNVVQHADAQHVTVSLDYQGNMTVLTVADDGRGMEATTNQDPSHYGQGLANMQARAKMLGGLLTLNGKPGQGTRLVLTIPCADGRDREIEFAKAFGKDVEP
jgi:signal transduction histidine kinase